MSSSLASARAARSLVALVALMLLVLGALVTVGGPAQFGPARLGGMVQGPLFGVGAQESQQAASDQESPLQEDLGLPGWLPVLGILVVSVLLALVVRSLSRVAAGEVEASTATPPTGDGEADDEAMYLGEVRRVLTESAARLRSAGADPRDVVVLCWERLEEQAERLGTPRPPHETPSEFSADLLRRNGAKAPPVQDLLALYHRARFGSEPLPAAAAERAAADLESIAASLQPAARAGAVGQVPDA